MFRILTRRQMNFEPSKLLRYHLLSIGKKRYLIDMETKWLSFFLSQTVWLRNLDVMEIRQRDYKKLIKETTKKEVKISPALVRYITIGLLPYLSVLYLKIVGKQKWFGNVFILTVIIATLVLTKFYFIKKNEMDLYSKTDLVFKPTHDLFLMSNGKNYKKYRRKKVLAAILVPIFVIYFISAFMIKGDLINLLTSIFGVTFCIFPSTYVSLPASDDILINEVHKQNKR